ncbi:hypothetical protein Naga_100022g6 [Nannochloropsis gaditana]|uniref:Uncharacterized protein n=1 Tax=Nannochloropsis gaditana TaxID=72520 RepID=W7TUC4_9STRA|nr:hypothetical protein Naga_100022g6 [Nannochloropsis gaditana]
MCRFLCIFQHLSLHLGPWPWRSMIQLHSPAQRHDGTCFETPCHSNQAVIIQAGRILLHYNYLVCCHLRDARNVWNLRIRYTDLQQRHAAHDGAHITPQRRAVEISPFYI